MCKSPSHQYIVTYYGSYKGYMGLWNEFKGPNIVWRDIVTEKLSRHDGPCVQGRVYSFYDKNIIGERFANSFISVDGIFVVLKEEIKVTALNRCQYQNQYLIPSDDIEHQYIVSYYPNRIEYRNILTDKIDRHDGPALVISDPPNQHWIYDGITQKIEYPHATYWFDERGVFQQIIFKENFRIRN